MFARAKKTLSYWYFRWNLETHLYMCEPWERTLVSKCWQPQLFTLVTIPLQGLSSLSDSVIFAILSLLVLVSYLCVPPVLGKLKSVVPLTSYLELTTSMMRQSDDL